MLALSPESVRLFAVDGDRAEEVQIPGAPKELTDVVGRDWEQNTIQTHTAGHGLRGAIKHGHGGSEGEVAKQELNLAAMLTAQSRGKVHVAATAALGETAPVTAIFRY